MAKTYYVYILASRSGAIYIGVTGYLFRRLYQHRSGLLPGHTQRYRIHRLVHIETYEDALSAITREKQIKSWRREKKLALIRSHNPAWDDLASDWFTPYPKATPSLRLPGKADPSLRSG
ncbi:MAG: GIY-YIG nuclease family protein [Proteobacteria bacterium]|nr:GIY-YIG nuclease family protein [Pseudomonadota bacterium]